MFVILSYDVNEKRVAKVRKNVVKYLLPVHRSVFNGEMTDAKLRKMMGELERLIDRETDSVVIFRFDFDSEITQYSLGLYKENHLLT